MSAKERIMTVRLLEKLNACPVLGKALGIEVYISQPSETADRMKKESVP